MSEEIKLLVTEYQVTGIKHLTPVFIQRRTGLRWAVTSAGEVLTRYGDPRWIADIQHPSNRTPQFNDRTEWSSPEAALQGLLRVLED